VVNKKKIDSYDHLFNFASVSFFVVPPRHGRYLNILLIIAFVARKLKFLSSLDDKIFYLPSKASKK
jgi:hypothetical protein